MSIKAIVDDIAARHSLRRRTSKWAGACPQCGGSKSSDRFNIYDDGGFKCYSCDFKGGIVTWLKQMESMRCGEAHRHAGLACTNPACPAAARCSMGDGSAATRAPRSIAPPAPGRTAALADVDPRTPSPSWLAWATDLAEKAQGALIAKTNVLDWLAGRGIDHEAARRYGLGWLDHDRRVERAVIGLQPKGHKTTLWVPGGLLIPIMDGSGRLHRLRVRRTLEARKRFLEDLKYVWLEGSGTSPMVLPHREGPAPRGAVIVEAELDAMAVAAAHPEVMVVSLGTVRGGIDQGLRRLLAGLPVILVALDADGGRDGAPGPGPQAVASWKSAFAQARFWPVPDGKDPGDYAPCGDLATWVESGLVPKAARQEKTAPRPLPADDVRRGEGGQVETLRRMSDNGPLEVVPALRWCPVCYGDLFLHASAGGYFCASCQPTSAPGRMVRAGRARGHYVVS